MKTTPPITLFSLDEFEVIINCLKVKEVEELLHFKESYFNYIYRIILAISNIDTQTIKKITIQDAMSLLVYYRMYFWDDISIADIEYDETKIELSPSDFIVAPKNIDKKETFQIGDYAFSPYILLSNAIVAEERAITTNSFKSNIRRYVLASGCLKGIDSGITALSNMEADPTNLGKMIAYTDAIKGLSSINVDFMSESGAIELIAEKEGEPFALGFRGSRFFSLWV